MASLVLKPDVIEFIDVILGRSDYNLEEICLANEVRVLSVKNSTIPD